MGDIMNILKKENLSSENKDFQLECNLEIKVRLSIAEEIVDQLNEIDEAKVEVIAEY